MNIIHYCWFGGNPKTPLIKACIESWSVYCPNYEIKEWNESNISIDYPFLEKAIKMKKWAFVSDFIRLKVLYEQGGVYLDTDIELVRNIDELMEYEFLTGWESELWMGFAFIIMKKGSVVGKELLDHWISQFSIAEELIPIPKILTPKVEELMNELVTEKIKVLSTQAFYPFNPYDPDRPVKQLLYSHVTDKTFAIHHWEKSWGNDTFLYKLIRKIKRNLGIK